MGGHGRRLDDQYVGTPVAPITFGAWGDPNLPRPIFRGAKSAYELGKDTWTNVAGTSIWYTTGINWWPNMGAQEETAPGGPNFTAPGPYRE